MTKKDSALQTPAIQVMERMFMLADPETSGGLLIAVDPVKAGELGALLAQAGLPHQVIGRMFPRAEGPVITVV